MQLQITVPLAATPADICIIGSDRAFTLIELSIVLVIIGLIVGGILVGQDLVRAAYERAQVTQIESFQRATATFYGKYGALPGDILPSAVTQYGFTASPSRAGTAGAGDGNGELDGNLNSSSASSWNEDGENLFFWEDLSTNSNLIEGSFNSLTGQYGLTPGGSCNSITACSAYFPYAKIGNGAFVYVYSGYAAKCCAPAGTGPNFFGLSFINAMGAADNVKDGLLPPTPALTVKQAYDIDKKIDDGLPTTGNVLAQWLGTSGEQQWSTYAATGSSSTCFDQSTGIYQYSITQNGGANVNCGLSFKFQTGD